MQEQKGIDMEKEHWKKICAFDRTQRRMRHNGILLFFALSFYFIVGTVFAQEEIALYFSGMAVILNGILIYIDMVLFQITREDGEPMVSYQRIRYFPVSRRGYILAKFIPVLEVTLIQAAVTVLIFAVRSAAGIGIAVSAMITILCSLFAGAVWYYVSSMIVLVVTCRTNLLPILPMGLAVILLNILI